LRYIRDYDYYPSNVLSKSDINLCLAGIRWCHLLLCWLDLRHNTNTYSRCCALILNRVFTDWLRFDFSFNISFQLSITNSFDLLHLCSFYSCCFLFFVFQVLAFHIYFWVSATSYVDLIFEIFFLGAFVTNSSVDELDSLSIYFFDVSF
jgi:hypothetical protein